MIQKTKVVLWACALGLVAAPDALAQDVLPQGFLTVNLGGQLTTRANTETFTFELYDEPGTAQGTREVGAGLLFDVGAGYQIWDNVYVGAGYSRFSHKGNLEMTALVPDPLLVERPRVVPFTLNGAAHTEQAFHVQLLFLVPFTDKLDVTVGGGPSFYSLEEDVLDAVTVVEGANPTLTGTTKSESEGAVGYNVSADVNYVLTERIGAGVLLRYTGATVDMPAGTDQTRSVKVGGFQVGGGLRFRF